MRALFALACAVALAGPARAIDAGPIAAPDLATVEVASLRSGIDPLAEAGLVAAATRLPGLRPADFTVGPPRLLVSVSLSGQEMTVRLDGQEVHRWAVSTGRSGYATPPGTYQPYRLATMWRSRQYEDAPMPFSIFFEGGYAIHGTDAVRRLGTPASHGCVRLDTANAETLFNLAGAVGSGEVDVVIAE